MKLCSVLVIACASVSEQPYKMLTSEDAPPFLCFCCFGVQKDEEVARLQSVVELLKNEIDSLKMPQLNVHWPLLPPSSEQATKESSKFSGLSSVDFWLALCR